MPDLPVDFRPHGIDAYRMLLRRGIVKSDKFPKTYNLASNIGYSLQYLEFLAHYYEAYDHHYTISKLLVKDSS